MRSLPASVQARAPRRTIGWLAVGAAIALSAPAQGQLTRPQPAGGPGGGGGPINIVPPKPGTPDTPPTLMLIGVSAVLGGIVVGAALIPSKRGHQD